MGIFFNRCTMGPKQIYQKPNPKDQKIYNQADLFCRFVFDQSQDNIVPIFLNQNSSKTKKLLQKENPNQN